MKNCSNSMITIRGHTDKVSKLVSSNFGFMNFTPDVRFEPEHHHYNDWRMKQWGCIQLEGLEIEVIFRAGDEMQILVFFTTPSPPLPMIKYLRETGLHVEGTYEQPQAHVCSHQYV